MGGQCITKWEFIKQVTDKLSYPTGQGNGSCVNIFKDMNSILQKLIKSDHKDICTVTKKKEKKLEYNTQLDDD